ncbi:MAG: heavy metal translocating P-type ATPase [Lachnospiraceae bacterium]|nr:heavy metal translocating P-type ATPase [Lachnospiraceae bacterium]
MNKKQKIMLVRIIAALAIFAVLMALKLSGAVPLLDEKGPAILIYLIPYAIAGWDVVMKAVINICHGQVFDENFLMLIATVGAFYVGEYLEAVAVMVFYQVGELFQSYAVGKSRQSIAAMMDICPETAFVETDGAIEETDPDDVEIGSIIVIRPGERVPIDAVIIEGESYLDTSALTGESVPRKVRPGDELISGCINEGSLLKARTTKAFEDSTVSRILELVESASERKAKTENFITRFAKYYTPIVTLGAVCLAVIPPLILKQGFGEWIERACTFLVISCPCALVISVPLGFFGGIGAASKNGILVKGSNFLETAADLDTVVFDKTGTLTKGEFRVTGIYPQSGFTEAELIRLAAHAESFSSHPIAVSVREAYNGEIDTGRLSEVTEIAGEGVSLTFEGKKLFAGNMKLMKRAAAGLPDTGADHGGTEVFVAYDGAFAGSLIISDTIKDSAAEGLKGLKQAGVNKLVMLTGDNKAAAGHAAAELAIDVVKAELLPADKVSAVEELLKEEQGKGKLAFAGDGINDAPVLTRADIGIAMGSMGSDAAIEAADIVIMDDDIRKISRVIKIARRTMSIVKQNIVFALAVKFLILVLGALGIANMWLAVFADVGVAVIAILNAMRTLKGNII